MTRTALCLAALLLALPIAAQAGVVIDWVTVGDPGNACDTQSQGCFGAVGYEYRISKFEVTNAEYAEFLNAVAASDTYELYRPGMDITRSGSAGSYAYTPVFGNEPVAFVSFYDALRFANWLHNGKPTGAQGAGTTEDGAYTLNGASPSGVTRNPGASVFLPSEDEWYKAAYYDAALNGGLGGYYDYPAGNIMRCAAPGNTARAANCDQAVGTVTVVGSYTASPSPWGSFDQGGNLWEWNEAISGSVRGLRGGSFYNDLSNLRADLRLVGSSPTNESDSVGFRVASLPEPATGLLQMAAFLGLAGLRRLRAGKPQPDRPNTQPRPRCAKSMIATYAKLSAMTWLLGFAIALPGIGHAAEVPVSVALLDIDSGTTSPPGNYRWLDVADQVYAATCRNGYNYTQASVTANFFTSAATLHGTLTAANLKPHFAYQFKLVGDSGADANERIGLAGRWWREEWNGSAWGNGQNLNDKGDGTSPNPNDEVYLATRDILDATSPTGRRYRYTGYLVFDYFITDGSGSASVTFEANSSYHVLWKTSQRSRMAQDGPLMTSIFDVAVPDPVGAYDEDYPESTVSVFGEWERLPVGGVPLPLGDYEGQFILTEESFHGSGLAGGWAAAMGAPAVFDLVAEQVPALQRPGLIALVALLSTVGLQGTLSLASITR